MTTNTIKINTHLFKVSLLLILLCMCRLSNAQIITQTLFSEAKRISLSSNVGTLQDSIKQEFLIETNNTDSLDIHFSIHIPKALLSEQWAILLTPSVHTRTNKHQLKGIELKGTSYAQVQDKQYQEYTNFLNSIIDINLNKDAYINHQRSIKEQGELYDQFWQFFYDEWERQIEYEKWKAQQDGSSQSYSIAAQSNYKQQLLNQYLLRIEIQKRKFLKVGLDTVGIHERYMQEYKKHVSRVPRFFVNNNKELTNIPVKFKDIHESGRTLDDITKSMHKLLIERDSSFMYIPIFDYDKIVSNETKIHLKDKIFPDIVKLPKNENIIKEIIIGDINNNYTCTYIYKHPIQKNRTEPIEITLNYKIIALDQSTYTSKSANTLHFIISAK